VTRLLGGGNIPLESDMGSLGRDYRATLVMTGLFGRDYRATLAMTGIIVDGFEKK
jgi:hypothetical protein